MELDDGDDAPGVARMSLADRRVLRAMSTADSAHTGVVVLRVLAALVTVAAIAGYALGALDYGRRASDGLGGGRSRQQLEFFLIGVSTPLALTSVIFAASYLVGVYAARLDMDIVLANENEPAVDLGQ